MIVLAEAARSGFTPRLVDALYTDALILADEAHGYFDGPGRTECEALAPLDRVSFSCASLRVTTRLMHVIGWLLTRRAVAAGEISAREGASVERRLGDASPIDADTLAVLPRTAREIADAVDDLYARIRRLDGGVARATAPISPVQRLMARIEGAL